MTFAEAISHNIRNALVFSGRDPRSSFWWYVLFVVLGSVVASVADSILLLSSQSSVFNMPSDPDLVFAWMQENFGSPWSYVKLAPVTFVWYALNLVPLLSCGVRRMHDRDRPGWWYVVAFVLTIAVSIASVLLVASGMNTIFSALNTTTGVPEDADLFLQQSLVLMRNATILSGLQMLLGIVLIVWMATAGTVGPNRYGEDPLT